MEQKNETFHYTYSAEQQEELRRIRQKYMPPEEDKMALLKKLDKSVSSKGTAAALSAGILGTLLFGFGMSCTMVWSDTMFVPGIILGLLGIALAALAAPLYHFIIKRERRRIAPEILRLTDELLK
ncbi:MAG: hypothetical protein ACI3XM_02715 [Eubacteriales bacterium]